MRIIDLPPVEGSLGPVAGAAEADADAEADTVADAVVEASGTVLDEAIGLPPH